MITYDELVKKHYILQQKRIDPFKSNEFTPFEGFGIECGKGWYNLLDNLCTKIEIELNKNLEAKKDFHIDQIKEKFGGLRFYSSYNEAIDKFVTEAEDKSYNTCENCGKAGSIIIIHGWTSTLCKDCTIDGLLNWKKDIIEGMSITELSINVLKSKKELSDEEFIELEEAQKWIKISNDELHKIQSMLYKNTR